MKLWNAPLTIFPENKIWNSKKEQPYIWTNHGWIERDKIAQNPHFQALTV